MTARVLELVRSDPVAWVWVPTFMLRIQRFVLEHDPGGAREAAWARDAFAASFGAGDSRMLGLLALEGDQVVGHVLAGVEVLEGQLVGWVHQVEHLAAPDRGLAALCQVLIDHWAAELGLKRLAGIAASDSRARRFEELGWTRGGRVMRKEVDHVLPVRGRRVDDDREAGDPSGAPTADPADG